MTKEERIALAQKRMANDPSQGESTHSKGAYTLPEGATMYKIREGRNLIDILPYRITNPKNPACKQGFKVGDEDYMQVYHVHQNIGTNKNIYLCNSKMYGGRCPICDAQRGMWDTDKEGAKKLYPKDRVIYNVIDLLEPEKGVQLFEGSYHWLEKPMRELATLKSVNGFPVLYGDRELGLSIEFYGVKGEYNGNEFLKPDHFNFIERKTVYDESILDKTYAIDSIFIVPNYKQVENDYYGIEEEVDYSEAGTISPTTPSKPVDEFERAVAESDKAIDEMQDKPEIPFDPNATPHRKRNRETNNTFVCPFGHVCGNDFDKTDDCTHCSDDVYNRCGDIFDNMKKH